MLVSWKKKRVAMPRLKLKPKVSDALRCNRMQRCIRRFLIAYAKALLRHKIWIFVIFRGIRSLTYQRALAFLLAIQQLEEAAAFDVASCARRLTSIKEHDLVCWIRRLAGIAACFLPHIRSNLSFLISTQQAESEFRLSVG